MSEHVGEKTEQPTPRRLEEAIKKGQFPRSVEVQTVVVVGSGLMALSLTGQELWRHWVILITHMLGHLHEIPVEQAGMQRSFITASLWLGQCVAPVVIATAAAGLLVGGIQSRFQTAAEALAINWDRVNPIAGLKRIFSFRAVAPTFLAMIKIAAILLLSYTEVKALMDDPIFYTSVDLSRVARFLAGASLKIMVRVGLVLILIAAVDYAYQFWRTQQDLMMTRDEVKDELKNTEGNQQIKSQQRRRRQRISQRKMLLEVPRSDVVVTNPTHFAVALRYDRKTMQAPKIVAKGSRLNALRIREIARQYQVPLVENKPLAQLLFKYGKVGFEIPAQLYTVVAEILSWVYRTNRYRYYREQHLQ